MKTVIIGQVFLGATLALSFVGVASAQSQMDQAAYDLYGSRFNPSVQAMKEASGEDPETYPSNAGSGMGQVYREQRQGMDIEGSITMSSLVSSEHNNQTICTIECVAGKYSASFDIPANILKANMARSGVAAYQARYIADDGSAPIEGSIAFLASDDGIKATCAIPRASVVLTGSIDTQDWNDNAFDQDISFWSSI